MFNWGTLSLNNIYVYGLALAIPLASLHFSTAYFISDVDVNKISLIFPSLAVLALVLEMGISQYIVASKTRIRIIINYLFTDNIFQIAFFLLVCSVFLLSGFVIGESIYYKFEIFLSFLLYAYSGFALSISRGTVDRLKKRGLAIIIRIISNIGLTGAIIIAYLGYDAVWSFYFCSLTRFLVAGPLILRLFFRFTKHKYFLKPETQSDMRGTLLKLSASGISSFLVTGLMSRSVWLAIAPSSAFSIYVIAAEFCSRISGFLLNSFQPFFHIILKRLIWFDILSCIASINALIFHDNRISSILALSIILVTTGIKLQSLLIYERHLVRVLFPLVEFFLITFTLLMLKNIFQTDLQLVNSWIIGQLICSFLCTIYLNYLKKEYEI